MSFDKTYNPSEHEAKIYQKWEDSGAFKPNESHKDPFTIILPPPNANGNLHLGHAMYVVEDILVRFARMNGRPTLWLPGADHAGIETQVVFERELAKAGQSRFDLGREEFFRQVMAFTRTNMTTMTDQLRSLGFSLDWSRMQFTLDEAIINTVYDTFKALDEAGYIYRGNRIVNWCPHCRSAFADIELKYREQLDPLYYIKYGPFVLATVRPETKFGDTAIAVHPDDIRYQHLIGEEVEAEDLLGQIKLKVVADTYVNPAFGTGAVKVTPAHDPNDWEIGQRHGLEVRPVIGTDGTLNAHTGRFAGMNVSDARAEVAKELEDRGLIDHIDMNYTHNVAFHDRCGTQIEPLVVEQWWLSVEELKRPAIQAIHSGEIQIVPERFKKVCLDWLENLRDWNISRQNWWGIRIPVYYNASGDDSKPEYLIGTEAEAKALYGEGQYEAETDNFDTWFSSGQWPFATLMATGDFEKGFYPTSVMETGRDILFLWVTRMVMLGIFRTGKVPFKSVYLHGMITDAQGKKMSKSKGNVINPLEMSSKYGTDALRLALTIGITPGNDGALSERKIEGYRNFCNKLWNVSRYVAEAVGEHKPGEPLAKSAADHWIQARLEGATQEVTDAINNYRFSDAGNTVYSLLWNDFADWYVEASKVEPNPDLLAHGLMTILQIAHPFAPFVTETIWQQLPWTSGDLISTPWPAINEKHKRVSRGKTADFAHLISVIEATRAASAKLKLVRPTLTFNPRHGDLEPHIELVKRLARLGDVRASTDNVGLLLATPHFEVRVDVDHNTLEGYRNQLAKELKYKSAYVSKLETQLSNKTYLASAPAPIVEESRERLATAKDELNKLTNEFESFSKI